MKNELEQIQNIAHDLILVLRKELKSSVHKVGLTLNGEPLLFFYEKHTPMLNIDEYRKLQKQIMVGLSKLNCEWLVVGFSSLEKVLDQIEIEKRNITASELKLFIYQCATIADLVKRLADDKKLYRS